ncbi:MAG TPA: amino acid adenylation domain-containing protein [Verrucomicrobiae bacterium]|nr:amino acid adenylation domain-containing protein [Verrucomicrobiae bacterium]
MSVAPQKTNAGIAIIGMAGRFPKARNLDEFWRNLCDGVEGISFFTDEELETARVEFPKDNSNYVKARGILEDADCFDAAFFGLTPREAEVMDPQHRVFLECAWEALEHAGCNPAKFDGAIGVFAGMSMNTYLAHNLLTHPELVAQLNEHQLMLGNDKDFLPTRVSYKLNLRGPSLNIQTACSTSLVAVCVACQNLLDYECDVSLAGAVSIAFPQKRGYLFQEGGIASPDGHCRAFDAKAAGTVAGEGVAIVVLKRLEDALAHGDTIYAVIKGFAMNNDGSNKIGYTAPGVEGQAEVIATAQAMAGFAPETIRYVETHGTATPLGDPIEIEGLMKAFRTGEKRKQFCALGAVKSNIGHLDVAAGVAGLIKTALALHHKQIPPSLHFQSPNPKIDFANSPFFVNAKLADWKTPDSEPARRAGVSSFGIGGTNAHVVLEEAPETKVFEASRPAQLLLLSARTATALDRATVSLAAHLKQNPGLNLADVAYTLQVGRHEFAHRRMAVCRDPGDAGKLLATREAKRVFSRIPEAENPPVIFMFPGQGAQQVNMARELYEHETVFREQVDNGCEMLQPHLGFDLRTMLYPEPEKAGEAQKQLTQTAVAQPALFVVEYALAKLWMSWGVPPQAMVGHSVGEYVAACLSGIFPLDDALTLVAARGRMMQQMPAGTMLAVRLPESEIKPLLGEQISLAAINAPSLCVISGPADAVETVRRALTERGVATTLLQTSHAFHSPMMEPVLRPFAELVGKMRLNAPKIPFISNVTGQWILGEEATDANYWVKHLRHTVRFADGVSALLKEPARVFLEVGPGRTLCNLAKQHPACGAGTVIVPSLSHAKDPASDLEMLLAALGELWLSGVEVDWDSFWKHEHRRRVPLPAYPFERKRYFVEPAKSVSTPAVSAADALPRRDQAAVKITQDEPGEVVPIHFMSPPMPAAQEEGIIGTLRTLLCDLSGMNPAAMNGAATFAELGFESLFLTQFSLALEKQLGVRVAFRQLLEEYSTLKALAVHIERSGKWRVKGGSGETAVRIRQPAGPANLPLTEAQRELWLASQISDAASCAYNECRLLQLRGELKENTLTAAIQSLVDRHEALRTTFAPNGDFQRSQLAFKLDVPLLDWSKLPADVRPSRLTALLRDEARLPFDLVAGPLLRAWLIRMEDQHHVLVLTVHHIVCDGHSLGVLLRELAEIYSAESQGAHSELAAPLQWNEYAREQLQENPARAADEAFWVKQFAAGAPVLELPTDRLRSAAWTFEGARESRLLPSPLAAELKRLGGQRGGTLFTTLLAAYGTLLCRLTAQDEIVVGIPVADRALAGGESLVGHCVNFLPLRLAFDIAETFEANLARVQKAFLEAYEHQHCTFGRLLQKLNLSRDASRMPLVSVTFNTQRLGEELKFAGLETELDANPLASTHFDLGFDVTDMGGALRVNCRYNTALFTAETIQRWLGHFQTLLEGIAARPAQKIHDLPLLGEAERRRILVEWNPAAAKPANYAGDKCIHELFEDQAARTPEAAAVTFENQSVTYRELNRRADRLAQQLRAFGVGPEVKVGLCLERSLEMVVGIVAILKAGGAYVPLDPAYPIERLRFMLEDAKIPVLLTQPSLRNNFKSEFSDLKLLCVDDADHTSRFTHNRSIPRPEFRAPNSDNLAYVIYTSGSTGQPKGVMVTHHNVTRLFAATQPWYQFNARDVWTLFHSVAFDFSVWEIWGALLYGGRLVVVPYLTSRSPEAFVELLARERVTVLNQTPSAFRQLIQAEQGMSPPPELALRYVIFGGEALEMQSLTPWFERHGDQQPRLVNMYGITETTVHVTYRPLTAADVDCGSVIGAPIPDLELYILDGRRQPAPIGIPGEIYVGGAGVARGYLNRPELTMDRFIPNPFSREPQARLYRTGDLARWLPNGDIEYLGRADQQVKIRGHRIEPGEIESALARYPAVRECVVMVREDSPGEKRLAAYLVANSEIATGELRNFLKVKLPDYMIPSAFVFLDKLPLTANGKVDRRALPLPESVRRESAESFVAPRTPTESALAEIWHEVLRAERVGIYDNFFELGGHSLLMTQVITRVREAFQIELPMRRFFESPTLAGLAAVVEELLVEEIEQLSDDQARRLARNAG